MNATLKVEHTIRSYSGRHGCMCGCKGTYSESERARKLAITALMKDLSNVKLMTWNTYADGETGCLSFDSPTRNRTLYLTAEGVEVALALGIEEVK